MAKYVVPFSSQDLINAKTPTILEVPASVHQKGTNPKVSVYLQEGASYTFLNVPISINFLGDIQVNMGAIKKSGKIEIS